MINIVQLFGIAGLSPCGPVNWGEPVVERGPGIYVIVENTDRIIYIGRASRSVAKRLGQFYRHKPGKKSPHHGGENILQLVESKSVYWASTMDFDIVESKMIAEFVKHEGRLPFGNKKRGDRLISK